MKLAFVGLGVMGFPMAGHLAAAGHAVAVFNRSPAKIDRWLKTYSGQGAASVDEAVLGCDMAFLCVGDDADVREVAGQMIGAMTHGGIIIDHTTASAAVAREMAAAASVAGLNFLDSPVSGGQAGAEQGALTIMAGGDSAAFDRAAPVMAAYAKASRLIGPSGAGQLTKMVNQICIAGLVQGLAEGLHFAKRAGLDTDAVFQAISQGAAQSWQMTNRWATMDAGQYDFGFAVDLMRKDLGIVLDEARANGAELAVTTLVDRFYAEVQALGGGRWDTSSLLARLEAPSNIADNIP